MQSAYQDAVENVDILSGEAQALVAALVGLIPPVLLAYRSSMSESVQTTHIMGHLTTSNTGKELIAALEAFITVTVNTLLSSRTLISTQDEADTSQRKCTSSEAMLTTVEPSVPSFIQSNELPSDVLDKARRRVYNEMPIRVLAFDPTGSNIRLMERSEIMRHILSRVSIQYSCMPDLWASELLELVDEFGRYAILSHTWIRNTPEGDVVYGDWQMRHANTRGYLKIAKFCQVSIQNHGMDLAWVDTVCINKDSSSELDESIRSMYKWYRGAHICITYLSETSYVDDMHLDSWFTRGWTLQELLAPKVTRFYNKDWKPLMPKENLQPFSADLDAAIQFRIQEATGLTEIEMERCKSTTITDKISMSRIMQLAASRRVTREEDEVYSLMGLLGVEITIAYGEGSQRALHRLMREVLSSKQHVLDIFNHGCNPATASSGKPIPRSIKEYLKRSPAFDTLGMMHKEASSLNNWRPVKPIISTHLGVRIPLLLVPGLEDGVSPNWKLLPRGDLWGMATMELSELTRTFTTYRLLDKDIYANNPSAPPVRAPSKQTRIPHIVIFGVLNFGACNDLILLPPSRDQCLSLPLNCGFTGKIRNTIPLENVTIIPVPKPVVFNFESKGDLREIHKDNLGMQGMQLTTLYL